MFAWDISSSRNVRTLHPKLQVRDLVELYALTPARVKLAAALQPGEAEAF